MKIRTVRLWPENDAKLEKFTKETGMTQTEFLNRAVADSVIIGLSESKEIAAGFMALKTAISKGKLAPEDRKEVEKVCQSCVLLMAEIENFLS